MPVGTRRVRMQTADDADRERAIPGQRRAGGGHAAGGNAGDLAEQPAPRRTIRAQPLGDGEHHRPYGTGHGSVVSSHCVQLARRLAWQLGRLTDSTRHARWLREVD